jgi:hypothetical protein
MQQEYSFLTVIRYAHRFSCYIKETLDMNEELIEWTNEVSEALGVDFPAQLRYLLLCNANNISFCTTVVTYRMLCSLPLRQIISGLNYVRMFLDQVCNVAAPLWCIDSRKSTQFDMYRFSIRCL